MFGLLLLFVLFLGNLAMKKRHKDIARGRQRDVCYTRRI